MPDINGYLASEMLAVENSSIVGGVIVGDNLILSRKDAGTINAGNVRGPVGATGPTTSALIGRKAYAEKTSQQTGITTTPVAITGLSITFTALATRRYRISAFCHMYSSVSGDIAQVRIKDGGTTVSLALSHLSNLGGTDLRWEYIVIPGAGSKTYSIEAVRASGTGSLTFDGLPLHPAFIMAEDIGT